MRLALLFLLFVASPAHAARVVATVPDLAAIAQAVGGEHVQVTSLAFATQDPHFVDARPNLALELARADLLIVNGLDLELGWLPTLLTGARNPRIQPGAAGYLDASTAVSVLERPDRPVDRAEGDIHPYGNPHYTLDPRNAAPVARAIAERLAQVEPEHADAYRQGAEAFVADVEAALARWEERAQPLRGKPVLQFHRSFIYLAAWLGLDIVADIEPKPGIPPTPRHILTVVKTARDRGVDRVLVEEWYPSRTAETVAEKAGATLVVLPGQTHIHQGQSYIQHIDAVVGALLDLTSHKDGP